MSKPVNIKHNASNQELIVSLTSYPPRFKTLHLALRSLLSQSVAPDHIYLWIAESDIALLPNRVKKLCKNNLTLKTCPDIRSFKKIIYTFLANPAATIVTCDDDVLYPKGWLESLVKAHQKEKNTVICHRARYMHFSPTGNLNPYYLWPNIKNELKSIYVFPVGVGGVLYPSNSFHPDLARDDQFLKLCPNGDDIWLKAMTLLNNTQSRKISAYKKDFKHIKGSQERALKTQNVNEGNDKQLKDTFDEYHIWELLKALDQDRKSLI